MTDKLSFGYDSELGEHVAELRGYRIRAVRDDYPSNPFEDWDCNWPIAVYCDRDIKVYDKVEKGRPIDDPLARFNNHALVHDQIAIAEALGTDISTITAYRSDKVVKYCRDADLLREGFAEELREYVERSRYLDVCAELYTILNIPHLLQTSRGYCQGDYAEVLVVATPEAVAEFGCENVTAEDLQGTVDLYSAWAWGDVYGYVVERPTGWDDDGEVTEWEEVENGSCWGYYGADFDKSGLAEAALGAVPDEPVRSPDAFEECA